MEYDIEMINASGEVAAGIESPFGDDAAAITGHINILADTVPAGARFCRGIPTNPRDASSFVIGTSAPTRP